MAAFDLSALGNVLGGLAQGYGAFQQSKAMKELLKMQKLDWQEEKDRKKRTQGRIDLAFADHKYDSPAVPLQ